MPKNRGNSYIARRGNESELNEQEMAQRLEERLREMDSISVEIPSRTRGGRETVRIRFNDSNLADVLTGGGEYTVNPEEGSCNCPDHQYRQGRCRHMEAVDIARDRIRQGILQGSENDSEILPPQFTTEAQRAEQDGELSIVREYVDDNQFYSEDPQAFTDDFEAAVNAAIPYEYENVLNGSDLTFGIEMEFVDGDSNAIARELYDMGICGNAQMDRYH